MSPLENARTAVQTPRAGGRVEDGLFAALWFFVLPSPPWDREFHFELKTLYGEGAEEVRDPIEKLKEKRWGAVPDALFPEKRYQVLTGPTSRWTKRDRG